VILCSRATPSGEQEQRSSDSRLLQRQSCIPSSNRQKLGFYMRQKKNILAPQPESIKQKYEALETLCAVAPPRNSVTPQLVDDKPWLSYSYCRPQTSRSFSLSYHCYIMLQKLLACRRFVAFLSYHSQSTLHTNDQRRLVQSDIQSDERFNRAVPPYDNAITPLIMTAAVH
jgi:hypothetical protein